MEISGKKLFGAVIAAAAAGATLGILFAPAKGKHTRNAINRKASDISDSLKEKYDDFVEELKCEYQNVRDKVKDFTA
jgi:gas vesicle protein